MDWFRFYSEALKDRKIKRVARLCDIDRATVLGVWAGILCLANDSPIRGGLYLAPNVPFSTDDLAEEIGTTPQVMAVLIDSFITLDMLTEDEEAYHLTHWQQRQFDSDSSTERVRQYRQRKQNETQHETLPQRSGNGPETDQIRSETDQKQNRGVSPEPEPTPEPCTSDDVPQPQETETIIPKIIPKATTKKATTSKAPPDPRVREVMIAIEQRYGEPLLSPGRQAKAIKEMLNRNRDPADIVRCWEHLYQRKGGMFPHLDYVAAEIKAFVEGTLPSLNGNRSNNAKHQRHSGPERGANGADYYRKSREHESVV